MTATGSRQDQAGRTAPEGSGERDDPQRQGPRPEPDATGQGDGAGDQDNGRAAADERAGSEPVDTREAAYRACEYVEEMTGAPPEVVTAVEPHDHGWLVRVEVLELSRVPETTDVLATYEVELTAGGQPGAYRRTHRYHRGRVGSEWT